jgi:hypothetical protein
VKYYLLAIFLTFCSSAVFAQAKQDKYGNEIPNTDVYRTYSPELEGSVTFDKLKYDNPNKTQPVLTLLKYDNKDMLSGNICVKEETVKMGFQYVVVCQPKVTIWNKAWVFFFNFGSNVELTFRNGFGWKGRLNDKIIECRRSSGDFVW